MTDQNETIIEHPRTDELAQAFKEGDAVQMQDAGVWIQITLGDLPKWISHNIRIVKKTQSHLKQTWV